MLASSSANPGEAFDRKGWIFEFKYDGYRLFAEKSRRRRAPAVAQRSVADRSVSGHRTRREAVAVRPAADRRRTRRPRRHRPAEFLGTASARGAVEPHRRSSPPRAISPRRCTRSTCSRRCSTTCARSTLVQRKQLLEEVLPTVGPGALLAPHRRARTRDVRVPRSSSASKASSASAPRAAIRAADRTTGSRCARAAPATSSSSAGCRRVERATTSAR